MISIIIGLICSRQHVTYKYVLFFRCHLLRKISGFPCKRGTFLHGITFSLRALSFIIKHYVSAIPIYIHHCIHWGNMLTHYSVVFADCIFVGRHPQAKRRKLSPYTRDCRWSVFHSCRNPPNIHHLCISCQG